MRASSSLHRLKLAARARKGEMPPPNPNLPYVPTRRVSRARAFDVWRCLPALRVRYRRSLFFSLTRTHTHTQHTHIYIYTYIYIYIHTYNTRFSPSLFPLPPETARRRITATSIIIVTHDYCQSFWVPWGVRVNRDRVITAKKLVSYRSATSRRNERRRGGRSVGVRPFRVLGVARARFAVVLCSCSFSCVQTLLWYTITHCRKARAQATRAQAS